MQSLLLKTSQTSSTIYIESGLFANISKICLEKLSPTRVHIVTDSNVAPLYLNRLQEQWDIPVSSTVLPAGEEYKRLASVERIYHDCLKNCITRQDLIIALGGGVIGDITGFAASTLLRGIPLCQVPTTLLAQVDSSIGGKTGVDLEEGKNLVGTFYQPPIVCIDPMVLQTLPSSILYDGMAEVIKYGCIANKQILQMCKDPDLLQNQSSLEQLIATCVNIKREIVMQDEKDTGVRQILNFGHTVGHAIEKLGNYTTYSHGQAVAIGMVAAMRIYASMQNVALENLLIPLLKQYHLPTELPYSWKEILSVLGTDKKKWGDEIHFVFVPALGEAVLVPLSIEKLQKLIRS